MMSHAARDPIFWATVAVAEQDFDGAGDLCIRCHAADGWLAGRSLPTDGSGLSPLSDTDGVGCDLCHRLTNPDRSEHLGVQFAPFLAHDGGSPPTGYYGSGQYVVWDGSSKLGPYVDADIDLRRCEHPDRHSDGQRHRDAHGDAHPYAHVDPYADAHTDGDADGHVHDGGDTDLDCDEDADLHADWNRNGHRYSRRPGVRQRCRRNGRAVR
jgi:hypothetical protein